MMLALVLVVAACSSDSDDDTTTTAASGETTETTVAAATETTVAAATETTVASGGEAGPIWVLLPDSASSPRWETDDRRYFEEAFTEAGIDHTVVNAQGDASTQAISKT